MKHPIKSLSLVLLSACISCNPPAKQPGAEMPLWPGGIPDNPVRYAEESVHTEEANEGSMCEHYRVYSQVSEPAYQLIRPAEGKANGVGMVICPGGGFRVLCYDREGIDLGLWLAERGITSLVLKYRTYNSDTPGFSLDRDVYNGEVYADARQAIHTLRSRAGELGIDPDRIGIGGYSAGGALSLHAVLEILEGELPGYAGFSTRANPDFACLIYPGIRESMIRAAAEKSGIPPVFMIVGGEDEVTPPENCIALYSELKKRKVPAELHVYAKGEHGFDSGIGRGHGVAGWQDSFIAWLKDMKIME